MYRSSAPAHVDAATILPQSHLSRRIARFALRFSALICFAVAFDLLRGGAAIDAASLDLMRGSVAMLFVALGGLILSNDRGVARVLQQLGLSAEDR